MLISNECYKTITRSESFSCCCVFFRCVHASEEHGTWQRWRLAMQSPCSMLNPVRQRGSGRVLLVCGIRRRLQIRRLRVLRDHHWKRAVYKQTRRHHPVSPVLAADDQRNILLQLLLFSAWLW